MSNVMVSMQPKSSVLVTDSAGYIGSHVVKTLKQQEYGVIVLDNLVHGHRVIVEDVLGVKLIVGEIGDRILLDYLFSIHNTSAVMHFAATVM